MKGASFNSDEGSYRPSWERQNRNDGNEPSMIASTEYATTTSQTNNVQHNTRAATSRQEDIDIEIPAAAVAAPLTSRQDIDIEIPAAADAPLHTSPKKKSNSTMEESRRRRRGGGREDIDIVVPVAAISNGGEVVACTGRAAQQPIHGEEDYRGQAKLAKLEAMTGRRRRRRSPRQQGQQQTQQQTQGDSTSNTPTNNHRGQDKLAKLVEARRGRTHQVRRTLPAAAPTTATKDCRGQAKLAKLALSNGRSPRLTRRQQATSIEGDNSTNGTCCQILSSQEEGANNVIASQGVQEHIAAPSPQQQQQLHTEMLVVATLVPSMLGGMDVSTKEINSSNNGRRRQRQSTTTADEEAPRNRDNTALVYEAEPLRGRTFGQAIRNNRWTQLNILVVISLIIIAIALGVFLAIQNRNGETSIPTDDDDASIATGSLPTEAPSMIPTGSPSEIPTWAPTYSMMIDEEEGDDTFTPQVETPVAGTGPAVAMQPSNMPTDAPITREFLIDLLPDYTQESLKFTGSPQAQAFEWLWDDPNVMDYSLDRIIHRFALKTFFNSIIGSQGNPTSILTRSSGTNLYGIHECDWNSSLGLRCDKNERVLTGIHLSRMGFVGSLPMEIGLLKSLRNIDMSQNSLTNTIPTTIGLITGLQVMNFGLYALTGSLPYSFTKMMQMRELILNDNYLSGSLPAELGWLIHLRQLHMSHNSFTGVIPGTLRHLTSLETLGLNNNRLQGTLPDALSDLEAAREFELQGNSFSGTIPEDFGDLHNLLVLDLSENNLMGKVPLSLENLYSITRLELQMNSFEGALPLGVCALKEFSDLSTIKVDCSELECNCRCVCFTDQPTPSDSNLP